MAQYEHNASLVARVDLSDELAIFRIRPDVTPLPEFVPGQYAELAVIPDAAPEGAKLIRRSYSIASPPSSTDELELYIVRVQGGEVTPLLWNIPVGGRLWLGPKIKGKFTLEEVPSGKDLVMVSTGTGLAPFLSMLRQHAENPPWRTLVLVHGARYQCDLGYREELTAAAARYPWFHYLPALTREPEGTDWRGLRGRVQTLFRSDGAVERALGEPLSAEMSHILLCGNPQMIDDIQLLLGERGLHPHKKKTPGNVHVERYW